MGRGTVRETRVSKTAILPVPSRMDLRLRAPKVRCQGRALQTKSHAECGKAHEITQLLVVSSSGIDKL